MQAYLDTCLWIYAVEDPDGTGRPLLDYWLERLDNTEVHFSHLTRMECLVEPIRLGKTTLVNEYEELWSLGEVLNIHKPDFDLAAKLRAEYAVKTPDALHLAIAMNNSCDEFWTNDVRLSKVDTDIAIRRII